MARTCREVQGDNMMSEQDRVAVERRLLTDRERALEALADFDEEFARSLQEMSGELSAYRLHPADIGSESMEREQRFLLASQEGERLYRIDQALRRLYDRPEGFGTCQNCGKPIGRERLEVVPESAFCADCQRAAEGDGS